MADAGNYVFFNAGKKIKKNHAKIKTNWIKIKSHNFKVMLKNVFFVRSEVIKFYTRFVSKFFFFSFCHLIYRNEMCWQLKNSISYKG